MRKSFYAAPEGHSLGTALTSMTAHLPSYAISRSSSAYSSVMGLQLCAGSSRGAAAAARSGTDLGGPDYSGTMHVMEGRLLQLLI